MDTEKLTDAMEKSIAILYDYMDKEDVPEEVLTGFICLTEVMDTNAEILCKTQNLLGHFSHIVTYIEERIKEELSFANLKSVYELDNNIKSGLLLTILASISASKYEITKECNDISSAVDDFVMLKTIEHDN